MHAAHGRTDAAARDARAAVAGFAAADMALYAAVARQALGDLVGGDEGRALTASAAEWMASENVKEPARIAAMLAPGLCGT